MTLFNSKNKPLVQVEILSLTKLITIVFCLVISGLSYRTVFSMEGPELDLSDSFDLCHKDPKNLTICVYPETGLLGGYHSSPSGFSAPDNQNGPLSSESYIEGYIKPTILLRHDIQNTESKKYLGSLERFELGISALGTTYRNEPNAASLEDAFVRLTFDEGPGKHKIQLGRKDYALINSFLIGEGNTKNSNPGDLFDPNNSFSSIVTYNFDNEVHEIDLFYLENNKNTYQPKTYGFAFEANELGRIATPSIIYVNHENLDSLTPSSSKTLGLQLRAWNTRKHMIDIGSVSIGGFLQSTTYRNRTGSSNAYYFQSCKEKINGDNFDFFTYRYAKFGGDDPATIDNNEAFDPLYYGSNYNDNCNHWGDWKQGLITGSKYLFNSNQISHQFQWSRKNSIERMEFGFNFWVFYLDQPIIGQPKTNDRYFGSEINVDYCKSPKGLKYNVCLALAMFKPNSGQLGHTDTETAAYLYFTTNLH